jgi:hypothetical protein
MIFRVTYGNPIRYYLDGEEVSEAAYRAASKDKLDQVVGKKAQGVDPHSQTSACWPMKSLALSCHPSQVAAITARNKQHGITGVTYEKDGTCIIADRGARRDLMRLEGKHDKQGGYGDDHASTTSPLHREDSVGFADELLEEGFCDHEGRIVRSRR